MVLYRHIRLDKNEPFYIGIGGSIDRAYCKYKRNIIWKRIVSKTDYEIEILLEDLTWQEACNKEKEFIKLYGRKDLKTGCLSNMTDGGEGAVGIKHTEETKKKISDKLKQMKCDYWTGKKHTEETKKKISKNKIGHSVNKGKSHPAWNKRLNIEEIINLHKEGLNGVEIAKKLNANPGHISRCIRKYKKDNL